MSKKVIKKGSNVPKKVSNISGFSRDIQAGDKDITFETRGLEGVVNVDDLTAIHMHNIEAEFLNISEDLTRVGMLKAYAEEAEKKSRLRREIYSANFSKNVRSEASQNSNYFVVGGSKVKLTENSLKEALLLDEEFIKLSNKRIEAATNFEMVSIVYWSLSEKAKKLEKLTYQKIKEN